VTDFLRKTEQNIVEFFLSKTCIKQDTYKWQNKSEKSKLAKWVLAESIDG